MRSKENLMSAWAFLIGVILAVIIGLFQSSLATMQIGGINVRTIVYAFLVILGIIIGTLIVDGKESMTFLIAGLAVVIVSSLGQNTLAFISNLSPILSYLTAALSALLILFIPATIIVALKTVFSIVTV